MRIAAKRYFSNEKQERLERIMQTTKSMLMEVGAEGLTMRALASASRVSSATLYSRFGSKDNIISLAIIDHFEQAVKIALDKEDGSRESPIERLIHILRLLEINTCDAQSPVRAFMNIHFKVDGDAELRGQLFKECYSLIHALLEEMSAAGALSARIPLELLAEEASDKIFSVVLRWCQGSIDNTQLLDRLIVGVMSILVAGLSGPGVQQINAKLDEAVRRLAPNKKPIVKKKPSAKRIQSSPSSREHA